MFSFFGSQWNLVVISSSQLYNWQAPAYLLGTFLCIFLGTFPSNTVVTKPSKLVVNASKRAKKKQLISLNFDNTHAEQIFLPTCHQLFAFLIIHLLSFLISTCSARCSLSSSTSPKENSRLPKNSSSGQVVPSKCFLRAIISLIANHLEC